MNFRDTLARHRRLTGFLVAGAVVLLLIWARSERTSDYLQVVRQDGAQVAVKRSEILTLEVLNMRGYLVLRTGARVPLAYSETAQVRKELGL